MPHFKVNSIILLFVFFFVSFGAENGTKQIGRMEGDRKCSVEDYPFLVAIYGVLYNYVCGGTLLSDAWVMTAAQCCKRFYLGQYTAYAGISSQTKTTGQKSKVASNIIHPDYNSMSLENDICLMRLANPFTQSSVLGYVEYAKSDDKLCKRGQVIGFGSQNIKAWFGIEKLYNQQNPKLQCVALTTSSQSRQCLSRDADLYDGKKFCAYGGIVAKCYGDCGGPFVCDNVQYGIISSGYGCEIKWSAGSYTNIARYHDFITDTMSQGCYSKINKMVVLAFILLLKYI